MREIERLDIITPQLADIVIGGGITKAPEKIDLGIFGFEADHLANLSNNDEGREYASVVTTNETGNLGFSTQSIRGTQESVTIDSGKNQDPRIIIHTHPVNTPFSSQDLHVLFTSSLIIKEPPIIRASLLITPSTKLLAINTKTTPKGIFLTLQYGFHPAWKELAREERRRKNYTSKEDSSTTSNLRMYALTRLAQSFRFLIYSCPKEANVVSLAS